MIIPFSVVRAWKPLPSRLVLKTLRGSPISASGGFGLLKIVLELDTEPCASENVGPPRGVDCEVPYRLERGTNHFL